MATARPMRPIPDQPESHSPHGSDQGAVPASAVNHAVVVHDPARQCQEQCPGLLGDAILVGARRDRHGDFVRSGGLDVDQVVADAGASDHSQLRCEREEVGRHPLSAGDQGVDTSRETAGAALCVKEKSPCGSTTSNPASERIWRKRPGWVAEDKDRSKLWAWSSRCERGYDRRKRVLSTKRGRFLRQGPSSPCVGPLPNLFSSKPEGNLVSPPPFCDAGSSRSPSDIERKRAPVNRDREAIVARATPLLTGPKPGEY